MEIAEIQALNHQFQHQEPAQIVDYFVRRFGQEIVLASSLGLEDQVLTHMVLQSDSKARIFVLDTGRLHQETYDVMLLTMKRYNMHYEVYFPDRQAVESLVSEKGPNSFYESVDNRKECCFIRKVEPLRRALSGSKAWITGQRKEQSVTRSALEVVQWDDAHGLLKINPLAEWTLDQVKAMVDTHDIPVNYLHSQGYPSIGCAPCTRAVRPGEDQRSGRWWWESPDNKECGLHASK